MQVARSFMRPRDVELPVEEVMAIAPRAFLATARPTARYSGPNGEPYTRAGLGAQSIAIVCIDGPLEQRGGYYWDGYDQIRARFEAAARDPLTKAIILKINSPGGYTSGLFEAVDAMRRTKAATRKPVFAYADETIQSAAYALACVADEIYIPTTGEVGSIGAMCTLVDRTAANAEDGYRVVVVSSGERKADGNPDVPLTDAVIARFQTRVDGIGKLFADVVAKARGMKRDDVLKLEADTLYGQEAVAAGLANAVLSFADVIARADAKSTLTPSSPRASAARTENPMSLAPIAAVLGLAASASEDDVLAGVRTQAQRAQQADQDRAALDGELCRATGADTREKALGVIHGWKASAAKLVEVEARAKVDEEARKKADEERAATAAKAERSEIMRAHAKKFTPAMKTWAETQPLETLKSFVASAPEVANFAPLDTGAGTSAAGGAPAVRASSDPTDGASGAVAGAVTHDGKSWEQLKPQAKAVLHNEQPHVYKALKDDYERRTGKPVGGGPRVAVS